MECPVLLFKLSTMDPLKTFGVLLGAANESVTFCGALLPIVLMEPLPTVVKPLTVTLWPAKSNVPLPPVLSPKVSGVLAGKARPIPVPIYLGPPSYRRCRYWSH